MLMKINIIKDGKAQDFTTITSGEVVIKRVKKAMSEGLLPLLATITHNGTYYNIL